jgi:curli biogenesis system outer membrane secretion channel CsgG
MKRIAVVLLFAIAAMSAAPVRAADAKLAGKQKRVAVFSFEDKTDHTWRWWSGKGVGDGMADMLTTALVKSGRYRVFERQQIEAAMSEQRLGTSGAVTQESAAKAGKMIGAEFAIIGAVTEFGYKQRSTGGLLKKAGLGGGLSKATAVVGVDVRFVNTTTGEVIKAESLRKEKSSLGLDVDTKQVSFDSQSRFDETIVGKATREAVDGIVALLDAQGGGGEWEAKIVTVGDGTCVINAGSGAGIKAGTRYVVMRAGEELKDPDTGESLGATESKVGEIEVTGDFGSTGKASNCRIVSGSIQKGDIVREKK